jgi:putative restriction endonuclease
MATQQGIWKPKQLAAALSFRTVYARDPNHRPYDDEEGPDGFLRYKWRGRIQTTPTIGRCVRPWRQSSR